MERGRNRALRETQLVVEASPQLLQTENKRRVQRRSLIDNRPPANPRGLNKNGQLERGTDGRTEEANANGGWRLEMPFGQSCVRVSQRGWPPTWAPYAHTGWTDPLDISFRRQRKKSGNSSAFQLDLDTYRIIAHYSLKIGKF